MLQVRHSLGLHTIDIQGPSLPPDCALPGIPRGAHRAMVVSLGDHIHVFFGAAASSSTTASPREILRLETDGTWNGNAGLLRQARHKAQVM